MEVTEVRWNPAIYKVEDMVVCTMRLVIMAVSEQVMTDTI